MTGPDLHNWRKSQNLTMQQTCELLHGDITQSTLSRWESSDSPIPQWASDILTGHTKVPLKLHELNTLLQHAQLTGQSLNEILAQAIRQYLQKPQTSVPSSPFPSPSLAPARYTAHLNEPEADYPAKKIYK